MDLAAEIGRGFGAAAQCAGGGSPDLTGIGRPAGGFWLGIGRGVSSRDRECGSGVRAMCRAAEGERGGEAALR